MTKAEIVKSISESTGVDKQASMAVVESFMEIVKESLAKDENVYLRGFGSFICKERKPKQHAIYPRTQPLSFPHTNTGFQTGQGICQDYFETRTRLRLQH